MSDSFPGQGSIYKLENRTLQLEGDSHFPSEICAFRVHSVQPNIAD